MEVEGNLENKHTHMSCVKAEVTDILSDRLGILTTVSSKERILFDVENLYVAGERCDPSYPLSSYVKVGSSEFQCNASLLQENNEQNVQYEATCVWHHEKPSYIKIFGHYLSSCSCRVTMVPNYVYKGHIAKVSPPDVALAVAKVSDVLVPVLIFLNNLFEDSNHRKLEKSEWIQDHLSAGDIVEFEFEKRQKRSDHRKYNVATFAWKTEWNMRQHTYQQKFQSNSSSYSEVKRRCFGDADDKPVSNAGASDVTSSTISHVCTSDVHSSTETNDTTPVTIETEIRVEYHINENKCASTSEASKHVSDGASEQLIKCNISPLECSMSISKDAYFTNASLDKSQESNVKAVASHSQEYTRHDTLRTVAHELTHHSPGKLEWHGGVGPPNILEQGGGVCPPDISKQDRGVGLTDISERGLPGISERGEDIGLPCISKQDGGVGLTDISEQGGGVGPPDISKQDRGVGLTDISERGLPVIPDQDGGVGQTDLSEQGEGVGLTDISECGPPVIPDQDGGVGQTDLSEQGEGVGLTDISECGPRVIPEQDGGVGLPDISKQDGGIGQPDLPEQGGGVDLTDISEHGPPVISEQDGGIVQPDLPGQGGGAGLTNIPEHVGVGSLNISEQEETDTPSDISEGKYGTVALYGSPHSMQDKSEKIPCLSLIGIVLNDSKLQTITLKFSYELFRSLTSPAEMDSQFRMTLTGFVTFPYELAKQPTSSISHHGRDSFTVDIFAKAGIRMPSGLSHTQDRIYGSSDVLEIALEMPPDPVKPSNVVAIPKSLSGPQSGMTVQVTGITSHEHKPCNILTSSDQCIQIPVTLDKLSCHNSVSEYRALISQGKVPMNPSAASVHSTKAVCSEQLCNLHSVGVSTYVQDKLPQEFVGAFENELNGYAAQPVDSCELNSNKIVSDIPQILVPIFMPLSLQSSAEDMSALSSTRWTLISGAVTNQKHCLMYVPRSLLSTGASNIPGTQAPSKLCQESPDQSSELSLRDDSFSSLSEHQHTCKPHCGAYSGRIYSLGYNYGTVAFTMDGREERASFYSQKVFKNGIKIGKKTKLRDVLYSEMLVTLDVVQYEGDAFKYKATGVYIESDVEKQLEGCQVAGRLVANSDEEAVSNDSMTSCHMSLKEIGFSVDQITDEDDMYRRQVIHLNCWDSFSVDHLSVRKRTRGCVCRTCASANTEYHKDLAVRSFTLSGQQASVAESVDAVTQETAGSAHLSEEGPNISDRSVLKSEVEMTGPDDEKGKVKVPESCAGFEAPGSLNSSEILDYFVPQAQKTTELNNNIEEVSTNETNVSDSIIYMNPLPKSSKNVPGVIDSVWSSNMVLMTATVCKLKVRVIIRGKNLYVDKKCIVMNTGWQQCVQGMQVFADVYILRDHPSGALYYATCAWKGKRPGNVGQDRKGESNTETCLKNHAGNNINSLRSKSKAKSKCKGSVQGRQKSESCEPMNIKCPTENKGINMHDDKLHCAQGSVARKEEKLPKTLQSKVFLGIIESFTFRERSGVVNFQFQNERVKAVFFREGIFVRGVSITDLQIKDKLTPGRLVAVSNMTPYDGKKDIPYAANIDIHFDYKLSAHTLESRSATGTSPVKEQQEVRDSHQGFKFAAETGRDRCRDIGITDHWDEVIPLCQYEITGDAHVTAASNEEEKVVQLPVIPKQYTGLPKNIKGRLARVKRYESSTRGVLDYSISGAELEVIFHKSVVNFCGNETTDLEEYLPVGSEVYFEGDVVGENKLLGCSDIVVTRVQEAKMQRKHITSKAVHTLPFEFVYPSIREGLFEGRVYEGTISEIRPPFAFVAAVNEGGKTYDVFVLNMFFSPVEYGMRLPANHPVMPYVVEGNKIHVMVGRRTEVNSKYTHEWFAVDAWTEEQDSTISGRKPEVGLTHKGLGTEQLHEHLEGVLMTVYPEWGILQVDSLGEEVTFFGKDTFLFGVRLAVLDLRQVLPVGERISFTLDEEMAQLDLKRASRAWVGSHDTSSNMHDIALRSVNIFNYCNSRKILKSLLLILINELGKQRQQLEETGRIQTSLFNEEKEVEEDLWLGPPGKKKVPGHVRGLPPSSSGKNDEAEEVYYSDSNSSGITDDEDETAENCEDWPEAAKGGLPFSISTPETAEERREISVNNTASVIISELNTSVTNTAALMSAKVGVSFTDTTAVMSSIVDSSVTDTTAVMSYKVGASDTNTTDVMSSKVCSFVTNTTAVMSSKVGSSVTNTTAVMSSEVGVSVNNTAAVMSSGVDVSVTDTMAVMSTKVRSSVTNTAAVMSSIVGSSVTDTTAVMPSKVGASVTNTAAVMSSGVRSSVTNTAAVLSSGVGASVTDTASVMSSGVSVSVTDTAAVMSSGVGVSVTDTAAVMSCGVGVSVTDTMAMMSSKVGVSVTNTAAVMSSGVRSSVTNTTAVMSSGVGASVTDTAAVMSFGVGASVTNTAAVMSSGVGVSVIDTTKAGASVTDTTSVMSSKVSASVTNTAALMSSGVGVSVTDTTRAGASVTSTGTFSKIHDLKRTGEGTVTQQSEHSTLAEAVETTDKHGHVFYYTETSHQHIPHTHSRTLEGSQACIREAATVSTEQYNMNVTHSTHQHLSMFHPDMHRTLQLSLCETLHKYRIQSDISERIASQALMVLEEEVWGVLRGKVLDTTLRKVAGLRADNENCSEVKVMTEDKAVSQGFQTLNEISLPNISEDWRKRISQIVPNVSVACHKSRELDDVEEVNELHSCQKWAMEGRVDKATQTASTGNVLFLKLLMDL